MGDVIKDLMEAANARIRSPFVGSIIFVFLAVNWRPVFNLLFGDLPVLVRLAHFDNVTDNWSLYVYPIGGGILFALLSPWLKFVGAKVASYPLRHLNDLQGSEAHEQRIKEVRRETELTAERTNQEREVAEENAVREQAKIEAAKRENEAEEVGGEELLEKVKQEREHIVRIRPSFLLTDEQDQLMIKASQDHTLFLPIEVESKSIKLGPPKLERNVYASSPEEAQINRRRRKVADKLVSMGLLSSNLNGRWRITDSGRRYVEHMIQRG